MPWRREAPIPRPSGAGVLARLLLQQDPLRWNGKMIPVGPTILVLNPRKGSAGPTLEMRYIDMREVFVDMNVIAEPPPGETYRKEPAVFQTVAEVAPRLEVSLAEKGQAYDSWSTTETGRLRSPSPVEVLLLEETRRENF